MDSRKRLITFIKSICLVNLIVFITLLFSVDIKTATKVLIKALSICAAFAVVVYRYNFNDILRFLKRLKVPRIFIDILNFSYRYTYLYITNIKQLAIAQRLKASRRLNTRKIAPIIAILLINSYEQSEKVYNAMIMRGYNK